MAKGNFNPFGKIIAASDRYDEIKKQRKETWSFIREARAKRNRFDSRRILPALSDNNLASKS